MKKSVAFIAAALMSWASAGLAGEGAGPGADAATTVKGSKSNTSERVGAAGADAVGSAERATSVKSSKSNSSERVGQAAEQGGAAAPAGLAVPDPGAPGGQPSK
jgi:hypothetical protein